MATMRAEGGKYVTAADLPKYTALKVGTNAGELETATAVTDIPFGIAAQTAKQNDHVGVFLPGQVVKAVASAAISKGAYVAPTTAGQMVTVVKSATPTANAEYAWGYAMSAATGQNDLFDMYFFPMMYDWT